MTSISQRKAATCERSVQLRAHKALVRRIAARMRMRLPANVTMEELEQAGLIGLNEALSRFEEGHGASFETYAARRIEGAMLDALRATDTLSRDTRSRLRQVRAAVQRLEHRLHRTPRAKEVANELGWTLQKFHDLMVEAGAGGARTQDEELEQGEEAFATWAAYGEDEAQVDELADPLRGLQARQRHEALNAAFDALEERERFVMEALYQRDESMSEVAESLGLSTARVSQINNEVMAKLKRRLRDW
ncbi:sigma-70 family RNA polymerase sigma factor [Ideonella sp. BN130291]|uniref:sigma-70 family RNA polymerase sigma factor n=1 Tax=Ideonella sp. BN130291 TaxID=3112940 RepID=UPI002E276D29|nr:sigma-70 family RNA polymerase sigma factor [Ideonella sp. BN130291]